MTRAMQKGVRGMHSKPAYQQRLLPFASAAACTCLSRLTFNSGAAYNAVHLATSAHCTCNTYDRWFAKCPPDSCEEGVCLQPSGMVEVVGENRDYLFLMLCVCLRLQDLRVTTGRLQRLALAHHQQVCLRCQMDVVEDKLLMLYCECRCCSNVRNMRLFVSAALWCLSSLVAIQNSGSRFCTADLSVVTCHSLCIEISSVLLFMHVT